MSIDRCIQISRGLESFLTTYKTYAVKRFVLVFFAFPISGQVIGIQSYDYFFELFHHNEVSAANHHHKTT